MLLSEGRSGEVNGRSLSFEVIDAVAKREGIEATDIEPPEYEALYDVINPEALDALFARRQDGSERTTGRVEFTYCGYHVVVTSDGDVTISE